MDINKILGSDYLDIIFDGRNKDYGAYELRKTYNKRLARALIATTVILLILFETYLFSKNISSSSFLSKTDDSVHLVEIKPDIPPETPPAIKPKPEPVKVATIKSTPPLIVKYDVKEIDRPPENKDVENKRIGVINQPGVNDNDVTGPPDNGRQRGIVETPKIDLTNYDKIFITVQIESAYPGGPGAWMRYLNTTFRYPGEAQEIGIQGTVVVQFIVDAQGNVSDVEAISGPVNGGLREEAVRVIRKSGKWEPAIQNGRKVKSYKKQPITFKLETE